VNYAIHLPLVDMLMGTFRRPPPGNWPPEYGVMKLESVPRGIIAQTIMPLWTKKAFDDHVGGPGEEKHA
jgi:lathosterol oxidase